MITPEWINTQIGFLNLRLGIYQPFAGRDFYFDPTPGFYGFISQGSTSALNEAIRMLADHIIAPSSPRIEEWDGPANPLTTSDHDWSEQKGPPGMIHYDGPLRSRIKIAVTNKHTPHIMGAILAHELTHHFLANKWIGYPDVTEDERLTDFATVFLGLGKLTLNGYHPIQWSVPRKGKVVTYTYQVGYLSAREIADVMCRVCAFRSIQLPDVQANLTDSARGHLAAAQDAVVQHERRMQEEKERDARRARRRQKWQDFISRFRRRPKPTAEVPKPEPPAARQKETRTRVVACISCGQKLRIPESADAIRVSCRACGKSFVVAVRAHIGG
ncbi:MAG: hypothetical protein K9N51_13990 [Candidatus Pacebacteria bacterium]|nr:hypothetical protein [Candidatus Paceibacterota bacterium]